MPMPPEPAQRVTRALQHAHSHAQNRREAAARQLQRATEEHTSALRSLCDARADELALRAALVEAGGRTWDEEQAERDAAARAEWERLQAAQEAATPHARARVALLNPVPAPAEG